MHIFPYSRRPGTPADGMPGQILNSVKEDRAHRPSRPPGDGGGYLDRWVGRTVPVLFEEERDGLWRGTPPGTVRWRPPLVRTCTTSSVRCTSPDGLGIPSKGSCVKDRRSEDKPSEGR